MGTPAFTYDYVGRSTSCNISPGSGIPSTTFHLRTPVNGMWACDVPRGWTYSATTSNLDCASIQGCRPPSSAWSAESEQNPWNGRATRRAAGSPARGRSPSPPCG
ncbi:hypothetical protein ACFQ0M_02230 [Kitasatospora aburaviensis]